MLQVGAFITHRLTIAIWWGVRDQAICVGKFDRIVLVVSLWNGESRIESLDDTFDGERISPTNEFLADLICVKHIWWRAQNGLDLYVRGRMDQYFSSWFLLSIVVVVAHLRVELGFGHLLWLWHVAAERVSHLRLLLICLLYRSDIMLHLERVIWFSPRIVEEVQIVFRVFDQLLLRPSLAAIMLSLVDY